MRSEKQVTGNGTTCRQRWKYALKREIVTKVRDEFVVMERWMVRRVERRLWYLVILLHRLEGHAGWLAIRSSKASAPQLLRSFALRTYSACL